MDGDSPEPQPFDPAQPEAPALADGVAGRFVLLVASDAADREWAERSAVALATTWAREGRILLADLSLARPGLHRVLGVDNAEGVTDAFLFGSSLQRVARPVRERGFLFVPAGTATARPEAVTGSPRWASVVDGCARAQATLVAFLPSDLSGGDALRERATDVLLLTDAAGAATARTGSGARLRAVLVPPAPAPAGEPAPPSFDLAPAGDAPVAEAAAAAPAFEAAADSPFFEPVSEPAADAAPVTMSLEEAEAALSAAEAGLAAGGDADGLRSPAEGGGFELGGAADFGFADSGPIELVPGSESTSDVVGGADLDLGLASLEAAPPEEPAQFGGELSFVEPAPELESAGSPPEPEPLPEWARAAETSRSAKEDLRSVEVPSREPSEDDARERTKPVMRPLVKPARTEVPKKSRTGALAALLAVAAAGAVGGAWYGVVDIPWLSAMLPARGPAAEGDAAASSAAPPPEQLAAPINEFAYALTLDSFTDPTQPRLQAASLNDQRPDLLFVVSPVAVNGKAYYQLLAGPAVDSAGAEALRATLQTVLTRENAARWALRATPFAFNLGDRDDLASAAERIAELSRVDIPAYVLELPGRSGGRPRYRVYGGAYADEQEAEYFHQLLVSKGFPDARLVQRIGRHPQ